LVLAKDAKTNPRALGEALADELRADPRVAEVSLAGPGFINMRLKPGVFHDVVRAVLADPAGFGRARLPGGPVNVEYVSANPTGPMHVGHGRGALLGSLDYTLIAVLIALSLTVALDLFLSEYLLYRYDHSDQLDSGGEE